MINQLQKNLIQASLKRRKVAYEKAHLTDRDLRDKLWVAHHSGATLEELGQIVGVTRQRIHQILKGD